MRGTSTEQEGDLNLFWYLSLDGTMVASLHGKQEIQGSSPSLDKYFTLEVLLPESPLECGIETLGSLSNGVS